MNQLQHLEPDRQFEAFATYCTLARDSADRFDVEDLLTGQDDESIDAAVALIGDDLVLTPEDAKAIFANTRTAAHLAVAYVFIQAKRTPHFDSGEVLKFINGVTGLFSAQHRIRDERLREFRAVHRRS